MPAKVVAFMHFLPTNPLHALAARAASQVMLPRQKTPTIEALFPVEGNGFPAALTASQPRPLKLDPIGLNFQAWMAIGMRARLVRLPRRQESGFAKPIPDAHGHRKQTRESVKPLLFPCISFSEMSLFNGLHRNCTTPLPLPLTRARGPRHQRAMRNKDSTLFDLWE
jgi:hypothetical protein